MFKLALKHLLQVAIFSFIAFVLLLLVTTFGLGLGWGALHSGEDSLFNAYLFLTKLLFFPLLLFGYQGYLDNYGVLVPMGLFWGVLAYGIRQTIRLAIASRKPRTKL